MAERNSTSSATRGSERGGASTSTSAAGRTGTQHDRTQSAGQKPGSGAEPRSTVNSSGLSGSSPAVSSPSGSQSQDSGIAGKVREQANAQLSSQKNRALEGLGSITQAVRETTRTLREQKHDTIARYVEQAADQVERTARSLQNKDVGELLHDAQRLARRQPAVFVGSAFALGLLGARFFKSSAEDGRAGYDHDHRSRYQTTGVSGAPSSTNYPGSERY